MTTRRIATAAVISATAPPVPAQAASQIAALERNNAAISSPASDGISATATKYPRRRRAPDATSGTGADAALPAAVTSAAPPWPFDTPALMYLSDRAIAGARAQWRSPAAQARPGPTR